MSSLSKSAFLFVTSLLDSLRGRGTSLEPFAILNTDRTAFVFNIAYSVLVAAPVAVYLLSTAINLVRRQDKPPAPETHQSVVVYGTLASTTADVGIYAAYGVTTVRSILGRSLVLTFPLVASLSLVNLRVGARVVGIFLTALVVLTGRAARDYCASS